MKLSGQLLRELQDALIDAFPDIASLDRMLTFELDKSLRAIAGEGSLEDIVFKLIQVANSQGWIEDLICAACNSNTGNQKLQNILQKFSLKRSNDLRRIIEERLEYEYDNLEELGAGAFGITYRGTIKNEQKDVVIKTLKLEEVYQVIKSNTQGTSKQFNQSIKSFEKEAEILSSFPKHPNIVKYHNYLTQKCKILIINNSSNKQREKFYSMYELELVFLVMEYIEGENLEEIVSKRSSPLKEAEALRYIQQIGKALTVVHSKGVLHRDIKPKNIMVRQATNDAVLIDFGIAREFNPNVTQTHTVSFTQGYAPPEQLDPKAKRGNYTDVYGLAATLYYLLTKEHPTHALFRSTQPLDEPKKINSNISDRVNEAILWGMELGPSNRPQTVQQWLTKLLSLETPIELKPPKEILTQPSILEPALRDNLTQKEERIAEYRKKVEEFITDDGKISFVESEILNDLQKKLELTEEEARAVRDEVLKPFGIYQKNLDKYRQVFTKLVDGQGYSLEEKDKFELKKLQDFLKLKDEDIAILFEETEQKKAEKSLLQLNKKPEISSPISCVSKLGQLTGRQFHLSSLQTNVLPLSEKMVELYGAKAKICWHKSLGNLDYKEGIIDANNSTKNIKLLNFIVEAKFYNPYNGSNYSWEYGISFRETTHDLGDPQRQVYTLVISSDKILILDGPEYRVEESISNLDVLENGSNTLHTIVYEDIAIVFINNIYIQKFDVSGLLASGKVFLVSTGIGDKSAKYENFKVWKLLGDGEP